MLQIKTIIATSTDEMDNNVNRWLGQNRDKNIVSITPFYRSDKLWNHGTMIVYEVKLPNA